MSLIMRGPRRAPDPFRRSLVVPVVALAALALVGALIVGLSTSGDTDSRADRSAAPRLTWRNIGPSLVPAGPSTGPRERSGWVARGFTHNAFGAVVAALNISGRIDGSAPRAVIEQTVRTQCFGDVSGALQIALIPQSATPQAALLPSEFLFRVAGGDPSGDLVLVDIAASTPQSRELGGYSRISRTLRWTDGDWQMQVPPLRSEIVTSVTDYQLLGRP